MAISRNRDLAGSLGQAVHTNQITLAGGLAITGVSTYSTKANLPSGYDSNNAGALGFTTDSDKLYVHTGQGWFNIAIVNTNPIWETQPSGSYELASDATAYKNGTATTITLAARDSEGFPLTWSAVPNTAFNNMAHISNDSSVFTIEPKSEDSAGQAVMPQGSVTFKASDGVNIISASSTFSLTFDATIANSQHTTILAKASGNNAVNATFTDASSNSHSVTVNGGARTTSFTPFHPGGYSTYFDGNDRLEIADADASFNFANGDFTIESWIYPMDNVNYDTVACQVGTWAIEIFNSRLTIWLSTGTGGSWDILSNTYISDTPLVLNEWVHFAFVRNGSSLKGYINGAETYSGTTSATIGNSSNAVQIGWYSGSYYWTGYMRDFRIVKGTAVYTAPFDPPTTALTAITNTTLLVQNVPCIKDKSSVGHTITETGTTEAGRLQHHRISPYKHEPYSAATHGVSYYSDGNGDYLSHNDIGMSGLNNFTCECWVYPLALKVHANCIYGSGPVGNLQSTFIYFGFTSDGTSCIFSNKSNNNTPLI